MAAYSAFAHAVQKEEDTAAFAMLSSGTRARLDERARALAAASGGNVKADAAKLFFSSLRRAPAVQELHETRVDGDQARVHVKAGSQEGDVQLVREQGSWHVDLSESLR